MDGPFEMVYDFFGVEVWYVCVCRMCGLIRVSCPLMCEARFAIRGVMLFVCLGCSCCIFALWQVRCDWMLYLCVCWDIGGLDCGDFGFGPGHHEYVT